MTVAEGDMIFVQGIQNFVTFLLLYCSEVMTSQVELVEKTRVPGTNHRLTSSH